MLEPAIQDKGRWWSREDLILLLLFGVLFFLPGLGQIALFDRDEPRFATAAREMAQRQDFLVPHFNGDLRPDKPPLIYWLMNAAYTVTGGWSELGARLPSAVCGTLTLVVVYFMVGLRFGRLTGLLAALILGSCAIFVVESRMATADATMLFFIVTCMACAWQAWDAGTSDTATHRLPRADYLLDRGDKKHTMVLDHLPPTRRRRMPGILALLFWVSLAGGTLAKGVPLLFVFVPMIVLSIATGTLPIEIRRWRAHLHVTRTRGGIALTIVAIMITIIATTLASGFHAELRLWSIILSLLFIGMILTPGLPGVAFRCIAGGNWRWWRQLRPMWGFPLLILLIAAWVVPVAMREPVLLKQMVGVHFLQRSAGPLLQWMHIHIPDAGSAGGNDAVGSYAKPPGFYLAMVWVTFWPWSILIVPAAFHVIRRVRGKSAITIDPRPYQFLLAWIIPMWIILELARGKLFHYPLPTYVGIAILCADALVQSWHRLSDVLAAPWFHHARWVIFAVWTSLAAAVLMGAHLYLDPAIFWYCVPLAGALLAVGVAGISAWNRPSWPFVTVLGWGAALLIGSTLVLPNIKALRLNKLAGGRMLELKEAYPGLHLAALGGRAPAPDEPTLIFYAGSFVEKFPHLEEISKAEYEALPALMKAAYTLKKKPAPVADPLNATEEPAPDIYAPTDKVANIPAMLKKIPFAPTASMTQGNAYIIAVDDGTLDVMRHWEPPLQFYELGHYEGVNVASKFKPVSATIITNVFLPREYVATSQSTSQPETRPTTAP